MKKIVINTCFGGFSLSDKAYERLIELGIPVRKYTEEKRNPKTGLYDKKPKGNEGEVIFDRELTPRGKDTMNDFYYKAKDMDSSLFKDRYWEVWLSSKREHPLLVQVVEELKSKANGQFARLKVVKIPDDVEYEIDEYDGLEHIAEKHRTWR